MLRIESDFNFLLILEQLGGDLEMVNQRWLVQDRLIWVLDLVPIHVNDATQLLADEQLLEADFSLAILGKVVETKCAEHIAVNADIEILCQIEFRRGLVLNIVGIEAIVSRHLFMVCPVGLLGRARHVDVGISVDSCQLDLQFLDIWVVNCDHEELCLFGINS